MSKREYIIDRLEEACAVWRRLPDPEAAFLKAGERGSWPHVIMTYYEAYAVQVRAIGEGQPLRARVKMPPPSPEAIDRSMDVLSWLSWLGQHHGRDVMRCVWLCFGEGKRVSTVSKIIGLHRQTVRKNREFGLAVLVLHVGARANAA